MSEETGNLHVFYRFTVPGVLFTGWLYMMVPFNFTRKLMAISDGAALLITVLLGSTVVIGWLAYYAIYPLWKKFLTFPLINKLRLYPELQVIASVRKMINDSKSNVEPEHVWSYFLWNYCHDSMRQRVKSLANYGHSLYLVSFAFIILPLAYSVVRVLVGSPTTLSRILQFVAGKSWQLALVSEALVISLAVLFGTYILKKGKDRIQYAGQIQWLALKEHSDKLTDIIRNLSTT